MSLKQTLVIGFLFSLLMVVGNGQRPVSPAERIAAPYLFSVPLWEVRHFPEKWVARLTQRAATTADTPNQRLALVQEYFAVSANVRSLQSQLDAYAEPRIKAGLMSYALAPNEAALQSELASLTRRQDALRPLAEETLEGALSQVLKEQGITSQVAGSSLIFPPVDIHLGPQPKALAISPRGAISLQETILLRGDM